jgi:hypothetical protein
MHVYVNDYVYKWCFDMRFLCMLTFQGILNGGMRGNEVACTLTPSAAGVCRADGGFSMMLTEGRAWWGFMSKPLLNKRPR